ncbi:Paraquat-inducible protein B [hydrothermal vent metagenome]|uniref:Paraquat-inducible protein B n=1 Tax=hydrothermal vent metagenome TaxID=652676 RepID=A0A1W1CZP2_9ZZZZ
MSHSIPKVQESSHFTLFTSIWIVPFIALMIAGWLSYQYFDNLGEEVEIIFPQNEGLIAGQSVLKFKNVPIGKVTKIYFDEDIDGVVVRVRMNSKSSNPYMTEHAKFWIVKPELGFSGISGLDTLISGTYIDVSSEKGGSFKSKHIGLTSAYQDSSRGKYIHLISKDLSNVSVGMPLYYKNMKVGKIQYTYLSLDNKHLEVILFIEKKYLSYIHVDSKFWIKNTMRLDLSKGKFDVDIAPLKFLLTGGIMFSSSGEYAGKDIPKNKIFSLYKNETDAQSLVLGSGKKEEKIFLLLSTSSIAGLSDGSVVRFEGFDVGTVVDISLSYNKNMRKMLGEILVKIETSVFRDKQEINSTGEGNLYHAVEEGLRAKITDLDPITGAQFINLTFIHKDEKSKIIEGEKYAIFPMTSQTSSGIMVSVTEILDKLNHLPFEDLVNALESLIKSTETVIQATAEPIASVNDVLLSLSNPINNTNALVLSLSEPIDKSNDLLDVLKASIDDIRKLTSKDSFHVLPDELNTVLATMNEALKETTGVVKSYDSNSLIKAQLAQTLEILTQTSKEMQFFLRMLNRKPNSLIFGDN